jgi:hypothetical protein
MSDAPRPGSRVRRRTGGLIAGLLLNAATVHFSVAASDPSAKTGEIPFEDFAGGNSRIEYPAFFVLRTEAQFRNIWDQSAATPSGVLPIPAIDFSKYLVIAFFGGAGSACEPYRITAVHEDSEKITVEITHRVVQGPNCTCVSSLGTPYDMVRIARVGVLKPIDYSIKAQPVDCRSTH